MVGVPAGKVGRGAGTGGSDEEGEPREGEESGVPDRGTLRQGVCETCGPTHMFGGL